MTIEYIKQLKKSLGIKGINIPELIALSKGNDPFAIGTKAHKDWALWFKDMWEQFGYSRGVHLRRIHYQIISQETPVITPEGKEYQNTNQDWGKLANASKWARYLKYIDCSDLEDRRNSEPKIYTASDEESELSFELANKWSSLYDDPFNYIPEFVDLPDLPSYSLLNFSPSSGYLTEVWIEKSTMNDVLIPVCQRMNTNLVTGTGEISITRVFELVQRVKEFDKPCRIFYISDFDPAGKSMPVAVSRKIEYFIREYPEFEGIDIKLKPIALNQDQIREYKLPRTPIKETERRKDRFEMIYGEGATELDALEALYPDTLAQLVESYLSPYLNCKKEYQGILNRFNNGIGNELNELREEVMSNYESDWQGIQNKYNELKSQFEDDIRRLKETYQQELSELSEHFDSIQSNIVTELEDKMPNPEDYTLPEFPRVNEGNNWLLDTNREYLEQLTVYKDFQGKK